MLQLRLYVHSEKNVYICCSRISFFSSFRYSPFWASIFQFDTGASSLAHCLTKRCVSIKNAPLQASILGFCQSCFCLRPGFDKLSLRDRAAPLQASQLSVAGAAIARGLTLTNCRFATGQLLCGSQCWSLVGAALS